MTLYVWTLPESFPSEAPTDIVRYWSSMIGQAMRSSQPPLRMQTMTRWPKHLQITLNIYQHVGSNRNIMSWTMCHQKQFGITSRKKKNSILSNRKIIVPTQANRPSKISKSILYIVYALVTKRSPLSYVATYSSRARISLIWCEHPAYTQALRVPRPRRYPQF